MMVSLALEKLVGSMRSYLLIVHDACTIGVLKLTSLTPKSLL